jgi:hypothetical protein
VTRIEEFLFTKLNGAGAPFLASVAFAEQNVGIEIVSVPGGIRSIKAEFKRAVIESMEFDKDETIEWPLDIIGFDCYERDDRWRFVLHCTEAAWSWQSEWPIVQTNR